MDGRKPRQQAVFLHITQAYVGVAIFIDLAEGLHLAVGLRPVDEGAFQPAVAAWPTQAGVNALGHLGRTAFAQQDLWHFTQVTQVDFGLARAVSFFCFEQAHGKDLGDVVHHG